jgi:hypothetical protein
VVTASASTSPTWTPPSDTAAFTTGFTSSRWWREATSGTTPPYRAWAAACDEMTLERIRASSVTAAQVSSHDVSIARTIMPPPAGELLTGYASTTLGVSSHMIKASSPLSW